MPDCISGTPVSENSGLRIKLEQGKNRGFYSFCGAAMTMAISRDTLWIMTCGPNSGFSFDNVCAEQIVSGSPDVRETTLNDNLDLIFPMLRIGNISAGFF